MGQVFRKAEQYLSQLDAEYIGQFVEIGTSRNGIDGSTRVIAEWAKRFDKHLFTVDMDINHCSTVIDLDIPHLQVINQRGEEYLKHFPKHITYISFLYLDNFDWDWHPLTEDAVIVEQQRRYQELGYNMNNVNSQSVHLQQMIYALPAMAAQSIVVCDDTWFEPGWGIYYGKGGAVVPLLLNAGYKILHTEAHPEYGTILGRGIQ